MTEKITGLKLDSHKPKLADMLFCFQEVLQELCKIYEFGTNKYGEGNWKHVDNGYNRFKNALMRHFLSGRKYDLETGALESAHVAYNALMVLWFELNEVQNDNTWRIWRDFRTYKQS